MKTSIMYAERMKQVKPSFIREILSVSQVDEVISFAGGLPNANAFPVQQLQKAAAEVLSLDHYSEALQYSTTEGMESLRAWIAHRYNKRFGMTISLENILLTSGSQQALDLIGKAYINPGDSVLMENPGYLGARQVWNMLEANCLDISVNEYGPNFHDLTQALQDKSPKLYYTIPNFQNPTGYSYSDRVREKIKMTIDNFNTLLIEDDPYGELFYDGEDRNPIIGNDFDKGFLLGSFSKTLAPGLRVGWIVASEDRVTQLARLKQSADLHSSSLSQALIYSFLSQNNYEDYLMNLRKIYRNKRDRMIAIIDSEMQGQVDFCIPEGGMFLWLNLVDKTSTVELLERCKRRGVLFVPGLVFGVGNESALRLNFSNASEHEIEKGIRIIAEEL